MCIIDALRQLNPLAEESVLHNIIVGTHHCNTTYYNMSDTLGSSLDWRIVRELFIRKHSNCIAAIIRIRAPLQLSTYCVGKY